MQSSFPATAGAYVVLKSNCTTSHWDLPATDTFAVLTFNDTKTQTTCLGSTASPIESELVSKFIIVIVYFILYILVFTDNSLTGIKMMRIEALNGFYLCQVFLKASSTCNSWGEAAKWSTPIIPIGKLIENFPFSMTALVKPEQNKNFCRSNMKILIFPI